MAFTTSQIRAALRSLRSSAQLLVRLRMVLTVVGALHRPEAKRAGDLYGI
jgi:hypothetical protein